ncbi:COP9 signalosome complex subunit 3 [Coemansia aciculifera]|uniref:COP9 signalosome complex subunit 3 n=1 Tax=Coemansia aciculifera TaxID=417176 RepID=A0A9W8IGP7_9FUNG|nr:COP9 signalosome complex subunit 3 [Coemansia aciculifera]
MNLFRSSAYNSLVSVAERAPLSLAKTQTVLVPILQGWRTPLDEFNADELNRALGRVNPAQCTLAYAQLAIDCVVLCRTVEQATLAAQAIRRLAAEGRLEQFQEYPAMLQRLADTVGRIGDHALACELLADVAESLIAQMAADPISTGQDPVQRLGRTSGVRLTAVHIECARQCILARRTALHQRVASRVLGVPLDALGSLVGASGQRGRAFLEYSYYSGMVFAALGAADEALRAWQRVFALPARHVSAIAIAAYKRRTLLHLAKHGTKPRMPPFFAAVHARAIEGHAAMYVALAEVCCPPGITSLAPALAKVSDMRSVLAGDENMGLAHHLVHELPAHYIRRCGLVYSSLHVDRLAELIGFSAHPLVAVRSRGGGVATEPVDVAGALARYIRAMNDPSVVLDDSSSMVVRFVPVRATVSALPNNALLGHGDGAERQWAEAVEQKVAEATALRVRLEELDRHLALTREYVVGSRDKTLTNSS